MSKWDLTTAGWTEKPMDLRVRLLKHPVLLGVALGLALCLVVVAVERLLIGAV